MTTWLIITRAIHIGSCLLFFGIFAFDRLVASSIAQRPTEIIRCWKVRLGRLSWIFLPMILVSGIAWFVLVAMAMSGQPLQMEILKIVWTQTQFGTVWEVRLLLWLIAVMAVAVLCFKESQATFQKFTAWFLFAVNACLLVSLAWAGHGRENSPWHLFADFLHLLAAGVWPAGLMPLFLLLRKSRLIATPEDWLSMAQLVRRFSATSLAAVSMLAVTGYVNSWFLVGTVSNLVGQPYGLWLLAKIMFFCIALAIAAVNLLRLKPRISSESSQPDKAGAVAAQLQRNVRLELLLGSAIIIIVAILGVLPPALH
jgi:putative copper resistance protein D